MLLFLKLIFLNVKPKKFYNRILLKCHIVPKYITVYKFVEYNTHEKLLQKNTPT